MLSPDHFCLEVDKNWVFKHTSLYTLLRFKYYFGSVLCFWKRSRWFGRLLDYWMIDSMTKYIQLGDLILRGPKWPNNTVGWNILRSTTILKIFRDIPLFWNSNLSFSCDSSSKNSSSIKNSHCGTQWPGLF